MENVGVVAQRGVAFVDLDPPFEPTVDLVNRSTSESRLQSLTCVRLAGRTDSRTVEPVLLAVRRVAQTGGDAAVADEALAVESAGCRLERLVREAFTAGGRFGIENEVLVTVSEEREQWAQEARQWRTNPKASFVASQSLSRPA